MRAAAVTLLSEVLPPKSDSQADELALAGEVILEPLKEYATKEYSGNWRHIVIAFLGTFLDDAIYSLRHYAQLSDPVIDKMLLAGRRYFDGEAYRDVVISECKTIRELEVTDPDDVEAVSKLPALRSLKISNYKGEWPTTELAANKNLEALFISDAFDMTTLNF